MEISNNVALVTGGSSGLGAATVRTLTENNNTVIILDNNMEGAKRIADETNSKFFVCDVSDYKQIESVMTKIKSEIGTPRICVNCAGSLLAQLLIGREKNMSSTDFMKIINVNLLGTFNVMNICADNMAKLDPINQEGERGVIINTASIAAFEGQIGQIAYSASKGGVAAMTLPAARELSKLGIRVMCIAPGLFATPMLLNIKQELQDKLSKSVPFPKRLGNAKEYSKLVLHIIHNIMLNGEIIRLDGALRLQ